MKANLSTKFIIQFLLLFISSLTIAATISFFILKGSISEQYLCNQYNMAQKIIDMVHNTANDYKINEITEICISPEYEADIIQGNPYNLENNQYKYISSGFPRTGCTVVYVDGFSIEISVRHTENMLYIIIMFILFIVVMTLLLGTLISYLGGKIFLKPLTNLCQAFDEIATGNFDVRIDNVNDKDFNHLIESFNRMAAELGSIETFKDSFISDFSHEFKTPLASINGFSELLKSETLSDKERIEYAHIISDETSRLIKLSSNILNISKIENQQYIIDKVNFRIDEQLRRVIVMLQHQWEKKDISFNLELENVSFYGNSQLLEQVWSNIIGNAIKFTGQGGEICVRCYENQEDITVKVRDNGIGMDEQTISRIFDKFYQGDTSHSAEGNGLGLALVKQIINLCGGQIRVKSQINVGSTFTIELLKEK